MNGVGLVLIVWIKDQDQDQTEGECICLYLNRTYYRPANASTWRSVGMSLNPRMTHAGLSIILQTCWDINSWGWEQWRESKCFISVSDCVWSWKQLHFLTLTSNCRCAVAGWFRVRVNTLRDPATHPTAIRWDKLSVTTGSDVASDSPESNKLSDMSRLMKSLISEKRHLLTHRSVCTEEATFPDFRHWMIWIFVIILLFISKLHNLSGPKSLIQ